MNPDIDDVKFNATSSRYRDNRASSPTKTRGTNEIANSFIDQTAFEHTSKPKPITSYLDASHAVNIYHLSTTYRSRIWNRFSTL